MTVYDASAPYKIASFIPQSLLQYFWLLPCCKEMDKNVLLWGPCSAEHAEHAYMRLWK